MSLVSRYVCAAHNGRAGVGVALDEARGEETHATFCYCGAGQAQAVAGGRDGGGRGGVVVVFMLIVLIRGSNSMKQDRSWRGSRAG
jgi:hypothetical protein